MHRRGALFGLVVLVAGSLAACTGGTPSAEPSSVATSVETARPTASPEPTVEPTPPPTPVGDVFDATIPPHAPDALKGPPSKAAAGEAAKYFMRLYPYASATGDLDAWDAMSGKYCDYCANARALVVEQFREGRRGVGGEIAFADVQLFDHREHEYAVLLTMRQKPWQTVDADDVVVDESTETTAGTADLLLRWDGQGWLVESVGLRRSGSS